MFNLKIIIGNKYFEAKEENTNLEYQADAEAIKKEPKKDCSGVRYQEKKQSKE